MLRLFQVLSKSPTTGPGLLSLAKGNLFGFVFKAGIPVFVGGNVISVIRSWEYFRNFMPNWKSVAPLDDPFNPTGYVIHDWGKFLVGPDAFNRPWWEWSFRRMTEDPEVFATLTPVFKSVTHAYNSPDEDVSVFLEAAERGEYSLNETCYALYHYRTYEVTGNLKRDLWTFCSVGGGELVTLGSKTKRAALDPNHPFIKELPEYVDTQAKSNDWFWDIRQFEFAYGALSNLDLDFFNKTDPRISVKEKCRVLYENSLSKEVKDLIQKTASIDKYNVARFCGLATIPMGLERTEESFRYEEIQFGVKNWRAF